MGESAPGKPVPLFLGTCHNDQLCIGPLLHRSLAIRESVFLCERAQDYSVVTVESTSLFFVREALLAREPPEGT